MSAGAITKLSLRMRHTTQGRTRRGAGGAGSRAALDGGPRTPSEVRRGIWSSVNSIRGDGPAQTAQRCNRSHDSHPDHRPEQVGEHGGVGLDVDDGGDSAVERSLEGRA
jgi:hypothetical protein